MNKLSLIKLVVVAFIFTVGLIAFLFLPKSEVQSANNLAVSEKEDEDLLNIKNYKKWTKVNDKPEIMFSRVARQCAAPTQAQMDRESKNPHTNKYINVYVNSIGKSEMMTKKSPKFPQGTIIVKEKLSTSDSTSPELLTVMIKREKGFNPENGDWEYMTVNGQVTEVTAKGKLENCQACHVLEKSTDYVSRNYLPSGIRQKLK